MNPHVRPFVERPVRKTPNHKLSSEIEGSLRRLGAPTTVPHGLVARIMKWVRREQRLLSPELEPSVVSERHPIGHADC